MWESERGVAIGGRRTREVVWREVKASVGVLDQKGAEEEWERS